MGKRARRRRRTSGKRNEPAPPPPSFLEENWKTVLSVIVVFVIVAVAAFTIASQPTDENDNGNGEEETPPPTGEKAPLFRLTDVDGESLDLESYQGRVVVLDLFATWCGPCETQMEYLNQLRAYYPKSEVVIISIDIDTVNENVQMVRDFRDQYHADWYFAMDTDGVNGKYGTGSIPTLVIIDKDGYQAWKNTGVAPLDQMREQIDPLL